MYRIYREPEVNLRIKPRKRLIQQVLALRSEPALINHVWSMDVMRDQSTDGHSIRTLNALDDFKHGAWGIEVDFSWAAERVTRA